MEGNSCDITHGMLVLALKRGVLITSAWPRH
jgi:hypothetical protein